MHGIEAQRWDDRAQLTPEQQQIRKALLQRPLEKWSEEHVQDWVGVIGLSAAPSML